MQPISMPLNGSDNTLVPERLTASRLEQHQKQLSQKIDTNFAEDLIRQEAAQSYEQAQHEYCGHAGLSIDKRDADMQVVQHREGGCPEHVTRLYSCAKPSSAGPMDRWFTLSPVNAQLALHEKDAMAKAGIDIGSLESLAARATSASLMAMAVNDASDISDEDEVTPEHALKKIRKTRLRSTTFRVHRVRKTIVSSKPRLSITKRDEFVSSKRPRE